MAIYTRMGCSVELTQARLVPIWIERHPGEVKWHYSQPTKLRKKSKVECVPMWFYKGDYTEIPFAPVCDGNWTDANSLRATEGWKEISAKLTELNPGDAAKYEEWSKTNAPEAWHFFAPLDYKQVA